MRAYPVADVYSWIAEKLVFREPTPLLFIGLAVVCVAAALLMARYRWMAFVAVPVIAGFAAFCTAYFVREVADPEVGPETLRKLGYSHAALVCACGTIAVALGVALFLRGFGLRKPIWIGTLLVLGLAPVSVLAGYNAADYLRFRGALKRATGLSQAQILALAARCAAVEESHQYEPGDFPPEFAPLHPLRVITTPGLSYASLYELGDIYFEFRIETTDRNQRIYFFTNADGPQKTTGVWTQHPELLQKSRPAGGMLTVSRYEEDSGRDWVVLPDRLLVIDRPMLMDHAEDSVKSIPLSAASSTEIKRLAADLKQRRSGFWYYTGITDGLIIEIHFSSSDERASDDILLHNAWTDDLSPLFDAMTRAAPSDSPQKLREEMLKISEGRSPKIGSVDEYRDEHARIPLWCVWRQWTKRSPGANLGLVHPDR